MAQRLLITGATGYLGSRVARRAAADGWEVVGTFARQPAVLAQHRLDVGDRAAVAELLQHTRPDVVIHTATGRDSDDWRPIADGAAYVAVAATAVGARLVHLSSDAIFSGRLVHYDETALPDPITPYGAAKAAAETAVQAIASDAVIVRTSLIIGAGDSKHEQVVQQLATGQISGVLFTDEFRKPVHVDDLVAALLELAASDYRGVLNVAGVDAVSRHDLGLLIAKRDGLDPASIPAGTLVGSGLRRPADVRLNVDRAVAILATRLRGAREFIVR